MTELFILRADKAESLVEEAKRYVAFIDRVSDVSLVDLAFTASHTRGMSALAIIASSVPDLRARLASAISRIESGSPRLRDKSGTYWRRESVVAEESDEGAAGTSSGVNARAKLAFVYPGVMSFYPDMLRDITVLYPECRAAFDELEAAMQENPEFSPSNFIFPPAPYYRHDADIFSSGAYAQALVSVYSASAALTRLMTRLGLVPDGVVGCAGGDLAAIVRSGAAGSPTRPERVEALRNVYRVVHKAVDHGGLPKTSMISLLLHNEGEADKVIASFPKGMAYLAMELSPKRLVYAIDPDFEEKAVAAFAVAGIRTMRLAIDRPFNTPKCSSLVPALHKFTASFINFEPQIPVYSCGTAQQLSKKVRHARNETAERWAKSVRFAETIRNMYSAGYRVFVEVGPRGLMTSAIDDILGAQDHAAIALNSIHRRGNLQLQHALAQIASLGAKLDLAAFFEGRFPHKLDLSSPVSLEVRKDAEMRLSRLFPKMTLLGIEKRFTGAEYLAEPKSRAEKIGMRKAALRKEASVLRRFESGAMLPLVADAEETESTPGVSCEFVKTFDVAEELFISDFAIGSSQLSYTDPNLKGLLMLPLAFGVEVAAEAAMRVMPGRNIFAIEDFTARRRVVFKDGKLKLFIRAERAPSPVKGVAAVRVKIRDDSPDSAWTWPVMEGIVNLSSQVPPRVPFEPSPLVRPRSVHWSGREIYPAMLCCGSRLRGISSAISWAEGGLDYEVSVPGRRGTIASVAYPIWAVDPLLLHVIASGFQLWRSQERFPGAFSIPFHMQRLEILGVMPEEGANLNCYMRLSGVTPQSQLCDITVTAGDGNVIFSISGWEEQTERVPKEYCQLLLQPANAFITEIMSREAIGNPATDVATAFVTDINYPLFERNEALWLKIMSRLVLNDSERRTINAMTGSVARRTEWLVGRIAAKEAVRRFMKDNYHARWSDADIQICPNPDGKPVAIGEWKRYLSSKLDIAIAHTAQFVVAIAAANARVGVDVESVNRDLSEEFANGVFTADEQEIAALSSSSAQALIRFWCAKEAVSKALGTGIRFSPKELIVTGYRSETGDITARLTGGWADAFKNFKGRDIMVSSRVMRDHALAFCFIPETMFG